MVPVLLLHVDVMSRNHSIGKGREGNERMFEAVNVSYQCQC